MNRFSSIQDVWDFLDAIPMFQNSGNDAANFSLDNIRLFCERLGNPQNEFPTIHVAGTNGKGTTCYLLEQIYSGAGYKTGMFTSPHLLRYHERFRVDQMEISDQDIVRFFQNADGLLNEIKLSYFEISTALAFWYFADQKVDIGIIETGLGGRLDSTNILNPEVSVITSIGLDHQQVLGDTEEEIAREKAGIIKPEKPVVIGNITGEPLKVIEEVAIQHQAPVYHTSKLRPEWEQGRVHLSDTDMTIQTRLLEPVNKWNVAIVWKVTELLKDRFPVQSSTVKKAIEKFEGVPGRFEKLHPEFEWYFSGAHNIPAIQSTINALSEINAPEKSVLVFSIMRDKVNKQVLDEFKKFNRAYFVEQKGERAARFDDFVGFKGLQRLEESDHEIILKELKTELVIFVGSFYFYPIIKRWTTNVS